MQERRSSTSLFGNMEERKSSTVSKKKIKLIPVETLPPIILYQTLDMDCVPCGVKNCGGSKKSQPGIRPLCQNHFKYFDKPRGWGFVFAKEVEVLNLCRAYGIIEDVHEYIRSKALAIKVARGRLRLEKLSMTDEDEDNAGVAILGGYEEEELDGGELDAVNDEVSSEDSRFGYDTDDGV